MKQARYKYIISWNATTARMHAVKLIFNYGEYIYGACVLRKERLRSLRKHHFHPLFILRSSITANNARIRSCLTRRYCETTIFLRVYMYRRDVDYRALTSSSPGIDWVQIESPRVREYNGRSILWWIFLFFLYSALKRAQHVHIIL